MKDVQNLREAELNIDRILNSQGLGYLDDQQKGELMEWEK